MKKLALIVTVLGMFSCSKEANYKHVYKVSYVSPKVSTTITNYYTFRKNQDFHNSEWIKNDFTTKNKAYLAGWAPDTLWIDSLGLIPWENYNQ